MPSTLSGCAVDVLLEKSALVEVDNVLRRDETACTCCSQAVVCTHAAVAVCCLSVEALPAATCSHECNQALHWAGVTSP